MIEYDENSILNYDIAVCNSEKIKKILDTAKKIAPTKLSVLITGESGTEKESIARIIYELAPYKKGSFLYIHSKTVSGASLDNIFSECAKRLINNKSNSDIETDTLFLDAIEGMDLTTQHRLNSMIETTKHQNSKAGGNLKANIRLISTTSVDVEEKIKEGKFIRELFHNLNLVYIVVPPLRERTDDILPLTQHFLNKHGDSENGNVKTFEQEAFDLLLNYDWPGNVMELENVIQRAIVFSKGPLIYPHDLPENITVRATGGTTSTKLKDVIRMKEKEYINKILIQTKGDKKEAARILGVDQATLYRKMQLCIREPGEMTRQNGLEDILSDMSAEMITKALAEANGVISKAADILGTTRRVLKYKMDKLGIPQIND